MGEGGLARDVYPVLFKNDLNLALNTFATSFFQPRKITELFAKRNSSLFEENITPCLKNSVNGVYPEARIFKLFPYCSNFCPALKYSWLLACYICLFCKIQRLWLSFFYSFLVQRNFIHEVSITVKGTGMCWELWNVPWIRLIFLHSKWRVVSISSWKTFQERNEKN